MVTILCGVAGVSCETFGTDADEGLLSNAGHTCSPIMAQVHLTVVSCEGHRNTYKREFHSFQGWCRSRHLKHFGVWDWLALHVKFCERKQGQTEGECFSRRSIEAAHRTAQKGPGCELHSDGRLLLSKFQALSAIILKQRPNKGAALCTAFS